MVNDDVLNRTDIAMREGLIQPIFVVMMSAVFGPHRDDKAARV